MSKPNKSAVQNNNKGMQEPATLVTCPKCKGAGGVFSGSGNHNRCICNGFGKVWLSTTGSGWYRPKFSPTDSGNLY